MLDAVEGGAFDHRVVDLIFKHDLIADFKRFIETVIAHDVAGEAGVAAEAVGVGLFARFSGASHFGAVGHGEGVGHMGFGADIQDGDVDAVVDNIQYRCHQGARLPPHRFTGLQIDLHTVVAGFEVANHVDQAIHVVIFAGDVVAAAEVDPLHLWDIGTELLLKRRQHPFQGIHILLTKGVEVQAV